MKTAAIARFALLVSGFLFSNQLISQAMPQQLFTTNVTLTFNGTTGQVNFPSTLGIPSGATIKGIFVGDENTPTVSPLGNAVVPDIARQQSFLSLKSNGIYVLDTTPLSQIITLCMAGQEQYWPIDIPYSALDTQGSSVTQVSAFTAGDLPITFFYELTTP